MRVKMESLDSCWEWQGATECGYGRINLDNKGHLVHRLLFRVFHGAPSASEEVRHKCDNPLCINPLHLEIGSHAENMMDRAIRTGVANRKLTPESVQEIRASTKTQREIAEEFGINQATVSNVKRGRTYKLW